MKEKTISCKLTTPELQQRRATVIAGLKKNILERKELGNGFEFRFSSGDEMLDNLVSFIKTERMCCDFFVFQLTVDEDTAWLKITGPEGSKEFLETEVGL